MGMKDNVTWISEKELDAKLKRHSLIDRFCEIFNVIEEELRISPYESWVRELFESDTLEEIEAMVAELEEQLKPPLKIVK
jgi:hypothetical protein